MTVNFRELFPSVEPVLTALAHVPLIRQVNELVWIFALVETGHLLFLSILGGAVLALNLRILGLVLPSMSVAEVERATRTWYVIGVIGTIATGVAMGITTARTLLPSGAFFVKMIALVAAILLSNVVNRQARGEQVGSSQTGVATVVFGLLLWFAALLLFTTTSGLNSGSLLIALAGAALLSVAVNRRHRPVAIGLSAIALAGWWAALDADATQGFALLGHGVVAAAVVPAVGISIRDIRIGSSSDRDIARTLSAFAATLAWVTVAAAGRWIGFS